MCAVITWLCMILIFHPKHNNSVESIPTEEEIYTDDSNKINNNSGISSTNTYAHASTLVFGSSQASSEYMYKTCHPLTKSGTINSSNCESAFQFGPLPIIPSSEATATSELFRHNNSIASTAPSMTTLVSHHQVNHGSNGKSSSMYPRSTKGSISASSDYFHVAMPDEKTLPSAEDYYDSRASYNNAASVAAAAAASRHYQQRQELEINDLKLKYPQIGLNEQEIQKEEYVPPPLSPARKSRGDVIQSLRPEQDRKRYTRSMMIIPCDEDMGEFGIKKNDTRIRNNDISLVPGRSPRDGQEEELSTTSSSNSNVFQNFQQQQALSNSMRTSFKEIGSDSTLLLDNDISKKFMNHSTSSLLLPLPFETSNYSISSSFNGATEERQKDQQSSSSFSSSSSNNTNLMHDTNVFNL